MLIINSAVFCVLCGIHKFYGGQIGSMVNILPSSAELSINIPEFYWWFLDDVCNIAGSYFSSGLILYVYKMSIALYADNSISGSPF